MAVTPVQTGDWARLSAMMQLAKAKNPALSSATQVSAAKSAQTTASVRAPKETAQALPANSPIAMRGYLPTAQKPASQGAVKGTLFDAYA